MDVKKEFTEILKSKDKLARASVEAFSSFKVADAAGAICVNDKKETAYDLRLPLEKGLLPPAHPVRLAARLASRKADIHSSLEDAALSCGYAGAKIKKEEQGQACKPHFFAETFAPSGKASLSIPLEDGYYLVFNNEEEFSCEAGGELEAFFAQYLQFATHILLNKGHGRIAQLEKEMKSFLSSDLEINGLWLKFPESVPQELFAREGILTTRGNYTEEGLWLTFPVSAYQFQIKDIINRINMVWKTYAHS